MNVKHVVTARFLILSLGALSLCSTVGCGNGDPGESLQQIEGSLTGSGAPNGAHYNLNIVGVPKDKSGSFSGSDTHTIFAPLWDSMKCMLTEGDFQVTDGNGTDGTSGFQLPNPDPENDGTTTYSVWARALGKPGGSASATTCATDATTGELYCSVYTSVLTRGTGKSTFTDVSKELLYIYADVDGDGKLERHPLFDSALNDYYWQYDNKGLKLAQLRFYDVSSTVP